VLFAGLSLFPSKAATPAAQQTGARRSETDLDRAEALTAGRADEAIGLLENLRRKKPPPAASKPSSAKPITKRSFSRHRPFEVALQKIPRIARPRNCWACPTMPWAS
jgi:hypothetical protein